MRNTALTTAFALLLTMMIPYTAFSATEESVIDSRYYRELAALEILEADDVENGEDYISRSVFVKNAIKLCGLIEEMTAGAEKESPFWDVTPDTVNYSAILSAYRLGIIGGTTSALFEPDKPIKIIEAVKILLCVLGYSHAADAQGGYPEGYLMTASQCSLLRGIELSADERLDSASFVRLIYNSIDIPLMQVSAVADKAEAYEKTYTIIKGETLLTQTLGIYKIDGILESNEYTSVNGKSNVGKNQVFVDKMALNIGKTNAAALLGYYVEGYYKSDEAGQNVLLFAEPCENKNKITVVAHEDIDASGVSTGTFKYFDSLTNKLLSVQISVTAALIYNGGQTEMKKELLCPENGDVTLIDNNSDGVADVIRVMNYTTIVVSYVDLSDYAITGKQQERITLDPNSPDYNVFITKKDVSINFEDIAVNYVISYAEPINGIVNIKYALVSSNKITGTVESISNDNEAVIGGETYKIAKDVTLKLGMTGVFRMDYRGVISSHQAEQDTVYGYLNSLAEKNGMLGTVMAQIFTEDGEWLEAELTDKITFNEATVFSKDFYSSHTGVDYSQLIKYRLNNDGKISAIYFAVASAWLSDFETELIENGIFRQSNYMASSTYRSNATSFNATINLLPSTVIFMVPQNKSDKSDFAVLRNTSLVSGRAYTNIYSYDADRRGVPRVCVLDDNRSEIIVTSRVAFVDSVTQTINSEGEPVSGLRCYYSGDTATTLPIKNEAVLTNAGTLQKGDIIQYSVDGSNAVSKIILRYSSKTRSNEKFITGGLYSSITLVGGDIKSVDYSGKRMTVDYGNFGTFGLNYLSNLWIYDSQRDTIEAGTIDDLREDSYVFMRVNYLQASDIIVFE